MRRSLVPAMLVLGAAVAAFACSGDATTPSAIRDLAAARVPAASAGQVHNAFLDYARGDISRASDKHGKVSAVRAACRAFFAARGLDTAGCAIDLAVLDEYHAGVKARRVNGRPPRPVVHAALPGLALALFRRTGECDEPTVTLQWYYDQLDYGVYQGYTPSQYTAAVNTLLADAANDLDPWEMDCLEAAASVADSSYSYWSDTSNFEPYYEENFPPTTATDWWNVFLTCVVGDAMPLSVSMDISGLIFMGIGGSGAASGGTAATTTVMCAERAWRLT